MEISSDAQKLIQQAGAGAQEYVNANAGNYGGKLTSGEVSSILQNYKPQASQVFSPANVQQTMTAPAQAPNYADPFALRDYFYNTPDVVNARKSVQDLTNQLNAFDTGQNQQQNYLENQTVAMPVITGEQANQARLGAIQREAIARDLLAKQSFLDSATREADIKYGIAQEQRGQLQDLIRQTGGKAGISYADTYDQAVVKADSYLTKKAEDEAKQARKQAEKDLLTNLYVQTFGTTPKKGMKTKDIQKKLGQSAKEKKAFQDKLDQLELQTKQTALASARQSLAKSSRPEGTDPEIAAVGQVFNQTGGNWDETARILADKGYDVGPGSKIDNELRRRNGLEPIGKGGTLTPNQTFNAEQNLAKQYNTNTKGYQTALQNTSIVNDAYNAAITNLRSGKSIGAQSQAIVTAFNKILDPTSVVRESEYARTPEGQSLLNQIEGYTTKLAQGGAGLSESELGNIKDTANALAAGYQNYLNNETQRIQNQAIQYGLNVNNIIPQQSYNTGSSEILSDQEAYNLYLQGK